MAYFCIKNLTAVEKHKGKRGGLRKKKKPNQKGAVCQLYGGIKTRIPSGARVQSKRVLRVLAKRETGVCLWCGNTEACYKPQSRAVRNTRRRLGRPGHGPSQGLTCPGFSSHRGPPGSEHRQNGSQGGAQVEGLHFLIIDDLKTLNTSFLTTFPLAFVIRLVLDEVLRCHTQDKLHKACANNAFPLLPKPVSFTSPIPLRSHNRLDPNSLP